MRPILPFFFDSDRAAVLNVRARLVIGFVEQHFVELPFINHFPAPAAFVEMFFLRLRSTRQSQRHSQLDCKSLAFVSIDTYFALRFGLASVTTNDSPVPGFGFGSMSTISPCCKRSLISDLDSGICTILSAFAFFGFTT